MLVISVLLIMSSGPLFSDNPDALAEDAARAGDGPAPPWPMFRGGPARNGQSPYDSGGNTGDELWNVNLGNVIYSSPAIGADGTIYVGCSDHYVYAVRPDGVVRWKLLTGSDVDGSPAVGPDGTVFIGSDKLYAIKPGGQPLWDFPTLYGMSSSPVVSKEGDIIFGTLEGTLFVLKANGKPAGSFPAGAQIASSPALDGDGNIYFGSHDGNIYSVSPGMVLRWKYPTGGFVGATPAIGPDRTVYAGSRDGYVYAVNGTGGLSWRYNLGRQIFSSVALGPDGMLYVGCGDGRLCALDAGGTLRWDFRTPAWVDSSPAVGADGTIYFGSADGNLYALFPNGTLKWRFQTGNEVFSSPAIASNGSVIFGSWDRHLYCIGALYNRPSAPRELNARLNGSGVELGWTAPANWGGKPVHTYRIFRGDSPKNFSLVGSAPGPETAFSDRNLTGPGQYFYQVTAVNSVGESPPGGPVNLTARFRPDPPRDLRALPGNASVRLEWEAPLQDGGAPILNFRIYWSGGGAARSLLGDAPAQARSFNQVNLENLVIYVYEISAVNLVGESDPSPGVMATPRPDPAGLPCPPREVSARSWDRAVDLTWAPPGSDGGHPITGYRLYREAPAGRRVLLANLTPAILSYRDQNLTNGQTYWYYLKAQNEVGESPFSQGAPGWPNSYLVDVTPPDVYIIAPANGSVVHSGRLQVRGRAQDLSGIRRVELSLDKTTWAAASGAPDWSGNLTLMPGSNMIFARATDGWDNNATVRIIVKYDPPASSARPVDLTFIAALILIGAVSVQIFLVARRRRGR